MLNVPRHRHLLAPVPPATANRPGGCSGAAACGVQVYVAMEDSNGKDQLGFITAPEFLVPLALSVAALVALLLTDIPEVETGARMTLSSDGDGHSSPRHSSPGRSPRDGGGGRGRGAEIVRSGSWHGRDEGFGDDDGGSTVDSARSGRIDSYA